MMNPGNSKYVKRLNRMTVLNIIKQHEPVSRNQLAALTGLTPPAITGIIRELLDLGFVEETGLGNSRGGRRPMKLRLNGKAGYVIGLEVTHFETVIACADLKNEPTDISAYSIDMTEPETGLPQLVQLVNEMMNSAPYKDKKFLGVGVAFPGLLKGSKDLVERSINLGVKWNGFPVKKYLEDQLGLPVFLESNAKAAALAERWYGGGTNCKDLVYVNLGEGISAGVIMDDQIMQGNHGYAGQIGHIVVIEEGPLCNCGNRGCIEAVCGVPALLRKAVAELPLVDERDPLRQIWQTLGRITIHDLVRCAHSEGSYAWTLFQQVGRYVGVAVANLINMYNPEVLFLGGKLSKAADVFLAVLRDTVNSHAFPQIAGTTEIKVSPLGGNQGVIGSCALVLRTLLQLSQAGILDDVSVNSERTPELYNSD
ncbi:ROK family transcriptional regulator [Lucifera butyrica]|nr:ROK family transcriptional regulator [Lucifera butyrica]